MVKLSYVPKKSAMQLRLKEPNQLRNLNKAIGYLQSVSENSMIPKRFLLAAQTHMHTSYRKLISTID